MLGTEFPVVVRGVTFKWLMHTFLNYSYDKEAEICIVEICDG